LKNCVFAPNGSKLGDRKCLDERQTSIVGHRSAILIFVTFALGSFSTPTPGSQHLRAGEQRNRGYNPQPKGIPMTIRICAILCFAATISITMAAQSEPVLVSTNIPKHPALACQARIGGVVKLTFALGANGAETTDVEAVSGPTLLKAAAMENVKTWRFGTHYADGKYETTFDYLLPMSGPQKVTFESFRRVEVATCLPVLVNE
jgi:outer membrane biosynthesis protein TonB